MHRLTEQWLEEYLDGTLSAVPRRELEEHFARCGECRKMAEAARAQAALLELLRPGRGMDPAPGFYARVMERIESEEAGSFWDFFFEPAFSRQLLATAALLVILVFGGYWMTAEPDTQLAVLVSGDASASLGQDRERDRGTLLIDLAAYQE